MVTKYCRLLEERAINNSTGNIWNVNDVPSLWKTKVLAKIDSDGYIVLEDGTVEKRPINE